MTNEFSQHFEIPSRLIPMTRAQHQENSTKRTSSRELRRRVLGIIDGRSPYHTRRR